MKGDLYLQVKVYFVDQQVSPMARWLIRRTLWSMEQNYVLIVLRMSPMCSWLIATIAMCSTIVNRAEALCTCVAKGRCLIPRFKKVWVRADQKNRRIVPID